MGGINTEPPHYTCKNPKIEIWEDLGALRAPHPSQISIFHSKAGEAREVMHCCLLIGYGASAVNPYLTLETVAWMCIDGLIDPDISSEQAEKNILKALGKGILKTMSKMGISTIQ